MVKYNRIIFIILQCSLLALVLITNQYPAISTHGQTIPSPTPSSEPATDTPVPATETPPTPTTQTPAPTSTQDGTNGGNNPATNTPQPGPTATPVPASTFAPTPEDGYLPTAAPCADSPTIQAYNNLNVRQGPGIDYEIIDRVVFLEVRPIIGRSQYDQWWLIQLADGSSGWVADATGLAQGYIGNVPIVPAPAINNQTPTPGTPWQPTPRASCTVTPTYTPSPTLTATTTPQPTATATAVPPTATATATATLTSTPDTNNEAVAATRIAALAVAENPMPTQPPTPYPIQPTATPLEIDTPTNTPNLLPIVGLILVAGGIFVAIARRQSNKQ